MSSASQVITGKAGDGLPKPVADMRAAILDAARSGSLDELRYPIGLNWQHPVIGDGTIDDPLAALRALSGDGTGKDVLAALVAILEARWAAVARGADVENSRIYVWPAFAVTGIEALAPDEASELARLAAPEVIDAMRKADRWQSWVLAIGADGTWHFFRR